MEEEIEKIKDEIIELLTNKRYSNLYKYLEQITSQDISALFEELTPEDRAIVFRLLPKDEAAEIFAYMDSDLQEDLINKLTDKELKLVIDELYMDDTVDLIEEMPSNVVKRILKNVSKEDRKTINELLKYPSDSAGSIMTTEFIDLKINMTVDQAFEKIRKIGLDKETVYTCYVLDIKRVIIGSVDIKEMLLADRDALIKDIMETTVITVNTLEDKEEVAKAFDKYDLVALPVVDKENRLVGIVTIDDAIDVLQDETTEDFEIMAAMTPTENSYFKTSVFKHAKNRILWLLLLMVSSMITGGILTHYEEAFAAVPLLVSFIPMIMGTGGNCGSQSSTLIIRGMAVDEIEPGDFLKAIWKEIRVALIVGSTLAVVNGIRIMVQYNNLKIAIVLGLTLIGTACLAKMLGCALPMLAKKLKIDPAIMAAPLISTILDSCSILIYFNIAVAILHI
jgi:magnesium transporter